MLEYRQDPLAEDPQDKIRIEKVTISTGDDAKLIRNTEKLTELFPKSAKKIVSPTSAWWAEALSRINSADDQQFSEPITLEDDEKQVINKIVKSGLYHSRAQSDFLGTTASTFTDFKSPRTTTRINIEESHGPVRMSYAKLKKNRQETEEIKGIFNDFYYDLVDLTEEGREETIEIDLRIMDTATEVGREFLKIKSVHDQEIIKNLAKDFTNLQKKNKFKHKLIYLLASKITDKKGLLEEYDKILKEEKIKQKLAKKFHGNPL